MMSNSFLDLRRIALGIFCAAFMIAPAALAAPPSDQAVASGSTPVFSVAAAGGSLSYQWIAGAQDDVAAVVRQADEWRAEHRIIDLHQHMDYTPELLARAIRVMDASGVGLGIDLTPGTVTPGPNGEPSEFEAHKKMEDTLYPGRWIQYFNLDYKNWDQP